jgi:hypothetical protein
MTVTVSVRSSGAPTTIPAGSPGSFIAAMGATQTVPGPTDEVVIEADDEFGSRKDVHAFVSMAAAIASGAFAETFLESDEPAPVQIVDEVAAFADYLTDTEREADKNATEAKHEKRVEKARSLISSVLNSASLDDPEPITTARIVQALEEKGLIR